MEYSALDLYPQSFSERMQEARDAPKAAPRIRYRVQYQRPKAVELVSVADAANLLGVSQQALRVMLGNGRIVGAYRARKGRRGWRIPLKDGLPTIEPGTRGPSIRFKHRSTLPF